MTAPDALGVEIVRHARARRMRLSVDPASGRVRLTLPPRASLKHAMAWAREQSGWIAAQRVKLPDARPFAPGALVPLEGEDVVIDWSPERTRTITLVRPDGAASNPFPREGGGPAPHALPLVTLDPSLREGVAGWSGARLICGGPLEGLSRRIESWLKRRALATLTAETAEYAAIARVSVTGVSVADPKARWGSCASTGAIRYSWRLILAPDFVRRSTVAHEVAHRIEMNHSPAFHAAFRNLYGADPAPARAWLKRHGAALHWVGR